MTAATIASTIASLAFAVAFTSLLRKLFTRADGTCPIDGKIVWAVVLVLNIAGNVLGMYVDQIPPVVWAILGPIVGAVIGIGGVQTVQYAVNQAVQPPPKDSQPTKPDIPVKIAGMGVLMLVISSLCLTACAAASPACKVIDVLHDGCVLLKYEENGKVESVQITPAELKAAGKAAKASREGKADGGAP